MLRLLDIFFSFLHLSLTAFNLLGWIWPGTRKAHLVTVGVTAASWFILGIWYGWGYCLLTDWQWRIKEKLGETNLPSSFIKYFADKVSGQNTDPSLVNAVTLTCFLLSILISLYVNFFMKKKVKT